MRSRGELASKQNALVLQISALKTKIGSLHFNGNLEEESAAYGPLQQEIAMVESSLQPLTEEIRCKDAECFAFVAKYHELKQVLSGDPAWKVSVALFKKATRCRKPSAPKFGRLADSFPESLSCRTLK